MSLKRKVNGKWVEVLGGSSNNNGEAINISVKDTDNLFESRNVEGVLTELSYEIQNVHNDLTNHKNNCGGSGSGSSMPTITSEFNINKSDGVSQIDIPIFFSSPNLGEGLAYVMVNNVEVSTQSVQQGNNTIVVPPLGAGKNIIISIYIKDRAGLLSNQLNWTVTSGGISIKMLTDTNADYGVTSRIVLTYTITCMTDENINVFFVVDGTKYQTQGVNGYNSYELKGLSIGVHKIEYWASSGEYETKHSVFTLIVVSSNEIILSTDFDSTLNYESGVPISIPYRVSIDLDEDITVNLYIDNTLNKTIVTRPSSLYWTITSLDVGSYTLKIEAINEKLGLSKFIEFQCNVVQGEYTRIEPIVDSSLLAWFDATNKTNNDSDRDTWVDKINGNIGRLYNFNYGSNGWIKQKGKEISELVFNGTSYVEIDMTPFANNFKNGATIELVFKTRDVGNEDARVLDITDTNAPYKGVYIDTKEAYLTSGSQSINASIGEDEYIHVMYDIDRINKYAHVIVNGVITKTCKLSDVGSGTSAILESFQHEKKVYLNSKKGLSGFGSCEITHLRIYDRNFTFDEILQNYLSTFDDIVIQKKKSDFNNPLKNIMPVMNITCDKDIFNTMTETNKVEVAMTYTSPNADLYGSTLTTATNCLMYWQGTSSIAYNVKNYNILLRDSNREEIKYSPYKNGIPQSLFCLKVNLMESTNGHNVGIADYVRKYLYTTQNPAQKIDNRVSRNIQGFPILLYINGEAKGVYDFNLDRYSVTAFGYDLEQHKNKCKVYEISANTNKTAGAFVPWSPLTGVDEWTWYKNDFQGIYPVSIQNPINDDYRELKELIAFVHDSTDEVFTTQFSTHFDKESVIRYYILVMTLGMVDSLGKNAKLVTFDGIKWYFDFYDCDTSFGLDNTGALKYDVDIEVTPNEFNTADSVLWTRVKELFWGDIVSEYQLMRNNNLTPDKIYECVFTNQIEKIPESQYNFSTQTKYLDSGENIMMSNGNRYYNLKRWIKERFIYIDTFFDYTPTTASYITLRSGIEGSVYLDIQTYYPMYIRVSWRNTTDGSGEQKLKIGRGKTVRFNGIVQAKDQEVLVYGAPHLKDIGKMDGMKPRHLLLNNANRLTKVECPNNTELINIQMQNCKYLQRIDLKGCTSLGSLSSSQVLDVSGCSNLRYLNAYGTIITSINTNQQGGNLVEMYVPKTLQTLSLRNQYSLKIIGIPNTSDFNANVNDIKDMASSISYFTLVNCPLVERLWYDDNFYYGGNAVSTFHDLYMNGRLQKEIIDMSDYDKIKLLSRWGNGLANANEIYIENSCHNINYMSFRGVSNVTSITLRNLPNLKTLLLGSNCSGCRWNNSPNFDADRYDLIGEFDWSKLNIINCPNIEEFRIHEFKTNQNQTWFTFKEGTGTIRLADKFPNLKLFECNMATQNIHQIILPQSLVTFMNTTWSTYNDTNYLHKWVKEKFNIDSIYFEGEHELNYRGVDLGNHPMRDVMITALYSPELIGVNIVNEWVNPVFNDYKSNDDVNMPVTPPHGRIDISNFKWREVSSWFAWIDFTTSQCEIIYPTDWNVLLSNITRASSMFHHCINPNFTWEFAMRFSSKCLDNSDFREMYRHAQLKEQLTYESDAVYIEVNDDAIDYDYHRCPFEGTNLKYVSELKNINGTGAVGVFRKSNLVKIGKVNCIGSKDTWYGFYQLFDNASSLLEVGEIYTTASVEGKLISCEGMFNECVNLNKIGLFTCNCNNSKSMYRNCKALTVDTITLPTMFKPVEASQTFCGCTGLTGDFSVGDLSEARYISNMFEGCNNLKSIHLNGIDRTTPLDDMSRCFSDCKELTSVTISGETIPISTKNMYRAYYGCQKLTNLIPIPNDFTYDVNMAECCNYCYALTDNAIYKNIPFKVVDITGMYSNCKGLINPVVNITSDNVLARNMFYRCPNIITLTANFNGRLLKNSQCFASHCEKMTTVNFKFPDSLAMHDYYQTGVEYYNMFEYCYSLNYVNLDMTRLANTNTRADFGGMFYQDKYIKEIHGLDLTYLKPFVQSLGSSGNNIYDYHNDSITYGGSYDELTTFDVVGLLNNSYNFRNITTITHTKTILQHLDTVANCTLGLTYNIMDAIDDSLNSYVDPELKALALDAISRGWTFAIV